jgi:phage tail tube protein FII
MRPVLGMFGPTDITIGAEVIGYGWMGDGRVRRILVRYGCREHGQLTAAVTGSARVIGGVRRVKALV